MPGLVSILGVFLSVEFTRQGNNSSAVFVGNSAAGFDD